MPELFTLSLFNDPNLVSYWRFEGNSNDAKGTNNGADTSITYGTANGKFGQGAGFAGFPSIISVTHSSGLDTYSAISVGGWFRVGTAVTNASPMDKGRDGYNGWSIFADETANKFSFHVAGSSSNLVITSSVPYTLGQYHFLVGVADSGGGTFYQDAVNVGVGNPGGLKNNTVDLRFGNTNDGIAYFKGALDDTFMFNRILTSAEVGSIYGLTTPTHFMTPNKYW